jgi:hypothetical protein
MVARGNKDLHRHSMSGLKVEETEKWGRDTARSRYGEARSPDMKAEDRHAPQKLGDANNLQGNYYSNNVRNDWRRGSGESAEGKPHYNVIKRRQG